MNADAAGVMAARSSTGSCAIFISVRYKRTLFEVAVCNGYTSCNLLRYILFFLSDPRAVARVSRPAFQLYTVYIHTGTRHHAGT